MAPRNLISSFESFPQISSLKKTPIAAIKNTQTNTQKYVCGYFVNCGILFSYIDTILETIILMSFSVKWYFCHFFDVVII